MKHIIRILCKLPAPVVIIISWVLSSRSTIPMPDFNRADKVVHFICFAGLAFCWGGWFSIESWHHKTLRNILIIAVIVSAYGCIDEIHQSFVPGRDMSVFDWAADTLGGVAGAAGAALAASVIRKYWLPAGNTGAGQQSAG